ncbi:unnamed protein product [Amoebophrya sp. A25]|nr:unnamed protein product [Amoebophrya sp. A25]|eukprot:GSA25T00010572001.1
MLKKLRHPHIETLCDWHESLTEYQLIYEENPGGELQDFVEKVTGSSRSWLQEQTAALYIRHLLQALACLHSQGVCHGRISPSTVVLTSKLPDAVPKLAEVGLSDIFRPNPPSTSTSSGSIENSLASDYFEETGTGVPASALSGFESLQQLRDPSGEASVHDDLWSIGVLAYFTLVGRNPFDFEQGGAASSSGEDVGEREFKSRGRPSLSSSRDTPAVIVGTGRASSSSRARFVAENLPLIFWEEDAWESRTKASRDFIRRLVCSDRKEQFKSAAEALNSEWISEMGKEFYKIPPEQLKANPQLALRRNVSRDRPFELAITTGGLILAVLRSEPSVLDIARNTFAAADSDSDGYLYVTDAAHVLCSILERTAKPSEPSGFESLYSRQESRPSADEVVTLLRNMCGCTTVVDLGEAIAALALVRESDLLNVGRLPMDQALDTVCARLFDVLMIEADAETRASVPKIEKTTPVLVEKAVAGPGVVRLQTVLRGKGTSNVVRQLEQYASLDYKRFLQALPKGEVRGGPELAKALLRHSAAGRAITAYKKDRDEAKFDPYASWDLSSNSLLHKVSAFIRGGARAWLSEAFGDSDQPPMASFLSTLGVGGCQDMTLAARQSIQTGFECVAGVSGEGFAQNAVLRNGGEAASFATEWSASGFASPDAVGRSSPLFTRL